MQNYLVITNTLFRQKDIYKTTWVHPCSKHWHLLDYVIVRACDQNDVRITRAMCGTGAFSTDHCLERSETFTHLAPEYRKHQKTKKKKYNIKSLHDPCTRAKLQEYISSCLVDHHSAAAEVDQQWEAIKLSVHKAYTKTIGHIARKHHDWFDENDVEMQDLLDCKRKTFCIWQDDITSLRK